MNSKKNSFKRVAAGALAVLTVAAYTAPVANVGGLPSVNILTSEAALGDLKDFTYPDLADSIISLSDTVNTFNTSQLKTFENSKARLTSGKTVTVNSSVPLTFLKEVEEADTYPANAIKATNNTYYVPNTTGTATQTGYTLVATAKSSVNKTTKATAAVAGGTNVAKDTFEANDYYTAALADLKVANDKVYAKDTTGGTVKFEERLIEDQGNGTYNDAVEISADVALDESTYALAQGVTAYNAQAANITNVTSANKNDLKYFKTNGGTVAILGTELKVFEEYTKGTESEPTVAYYTINDADKKANVATSWANINVGEKYYTIDAAASDEVAIGQAISVATYTLKGTNLAFNMNTGASKTGSIAAAEKDNYSYFADNTVVKKAGKTAGGVWTAVVPVTSNGKYKFEETAVTAANAGADTYSEAAPLAVPAESDVFTADGATNGFLTLNNNAYTFSNTTSVAHGENLTATIYTPAQKNGNIVINGGKEYAVLAEKDGTDATKNNPVTKTKTSDGYIYSFAMPEANIKAVGQTTNVVVSKNGFFYNYSNNNTPADETDDFAYKVDYTPVATVAAAFTNADFTIDGGALANNNNAAYAYFATKKESDKKTAAVDTTTYNAVQLLANKKTKFASDVAFQLITWSGNASDGRVSIKSTYDTKTSKYVAEYTVPELSATNVYAPQIAIVPAKENVTLSKSTDGTQIVANGESAENVPVASVAASYEKLNTTTGTTDVIKVANNTSVENGTTVKVDLEVLKKFIDRNTINTADYVVSVTRDGQQIAKDDKGNGQDITPSGQIAGDSYKKTYEFSKAGKYSVNLTVYKQNATATGFDVYTITYNFAIGSLADLTAESVDLTATSEKLVGKNGDDKVTKVGIIDGVVEFAVDETWDGQTVNVGAALFAPKKDAQGKDVRTAFTNANFNGATYKVEGNEKSSTIGEIQTLTITYSSDSYSSTKPITVKWKLVEAAKIPSITFTKDAYNQPLGLGYDKDHPLVNSIDEIANLKTNILNQLEIKNIDENDLEFEYIDGLNASIDQDELDEHYIGLPAKEGDFSVFVRYNDESMVVVNLKVSSHAAYVTPAKAQLNVEFGDIEKDALADKAFVKLKDYTIKNAKGKTIKVELENLNAEVKNCVYDAKDTKKTTPLFVKDADGKDTTIYQTDALTANNFNNGYLKAGTYVLSITGGSTADKEYSTANVTYILTVAPKQLTADMILIDPIEYNNGQKITPQIGDAEAIHAVAKYPGLGIKVAGGTTSASAIGDYNITIGVADGNKDYKGTVSVQWHIVKKATSTELTSLKWDEKATAIFDNGRIHVEINRPADDQFTDKIKRYGVIIEKDGKLAEPAIDPATGKYVTTGTEYDKAKKALVVGNGFKEGNQSDIQKKNTPLIYGANINVKDPKTSIWVRPYIELENGQIYYGTVKCLNLEQEATEKLNLIMAEAGAVNATTGVAEAAVTKDSAYKANANATKLNKRKAIRSGYNDKVGKFYVYGSYTIPEKSENSETAVETFGVIVDKTGKLAANADKADVAKKLVLGEGFIEGHADPNSKTMEADEYGANIKPKDSVTGVWVRAYVDLGNGLVVYTDPVYIKPVSDQYETQKNAAAFDKTHGKTGILAGTTKTRLAFTAPAAPAGATIKQAGVVADKTGSLYTEVAGVAVLNADAGAKLLLGKGYTEGKKTNFTNGTEYGANVTPNSGKVIVARPYIIYTINGVDVTVYGAVEIIKDAQN